MSSIDELIQDLDTTREHLALPKVRVSLKPIQQDAGWLLSTDVCILLARRTAESPETIAEKFLERLPQQVGGSWGRIAGYITFLISADSELYVDTRKSSFESEQLRIFVPQRSTHQSLGSYLRLASLAILQGLWATRQHVPMVLEIADEDYSQLLNSHDLGQIVNRVRASAIREQRSGNSTAEKCLEFLKRDPLSRYSLFMGPGEISPSFFRSGAEILPFDEQVSLIIPDRNWFLEVDAPPVDFNWLEQIPRGFYSLLLHLAGDCRGLDVEWRSPLFQERKNFCWLLSTLGQRIEMLGGKATAAGPGCPIASISNEPTSIDFSRRFLPLFGERAVNFGEVTQYISVATQVSETLSQALNQPNLRIGLEKQDPLALKQLSQLEPSIRLLQALFFDVD